MAKQQTPYHSYWTIIWEQFKNHRFGTYALGIVTAFIVVGIYAPLLASSKPLLVRFEGSWYFPLFAYLFTTSFYTKNIDIFFNLLIVIFPLFLLTVVYGRSFRTILLSILLFVQIALFSFFCLKIPVDPASDPTLNIGYHAAIQERQQMHLGVDWSFDLSYQTAYAKLNQVLRYRQRKEQHLRLQEFAGEYGANAKKRWLAGMIAKKRSKLRQEGVADDDQPKREALVAQILAETKDLSLITALPTLWYVDQQNHARMLGSHQRDLESNLEALREVKQELKTGDDTPEDVILQVAQIVQSNEEILVKMRYIEERQEWLEAKQGDISFLVMPLLRAFHWEDDAGGEQAINRYIPWMERTRINRKDLVAALLFGIRISLVVGLLAVGLSLIIGVPIGSLAGYYGGKIDMIVSRLLEVWESMPTFFMLLLVVAIMQSKSIFLVIGVIGLFGWTGFSRFIRGEFFKQRNLSYVEACKSQGFSNRRIIFSHILPNAIPPLLTLLPFSVMGAITSEAGLSFLGLGEEGSCSWGVLMDEGRQAFPGESYLLWPPAILLTLLLVSIALIGDALRDALDPKMHR